MVIVMGMGLGLGLGMTVGEEGIGEGLFNKAKMEKARAIRAREKSRRRILDNYIVIGYSG